MSRPFSYNDENFTVIGNMLFIHVKLNRAFESNENIIEIPPEIYYRVINYSIMGTLEGLDKNYVNSFTWKAFISEENGKYYIKTAVELNGNFVFSAYMYLKDI